MPEAVVDDEPLVLRKLRPKIPEHDNAHPIAKNMMLRKDKGCVNGDCLIPMLSEGGMLVTTIFTQESNKISMKQCCR
jgi:hypothetical protein